MLHWVHSAGYSRLWLMFSSRFIPQTHISSHRFLLVPKSAGYDPATAAWYSVYQPAEHDTLTSDTIAQGWAGVRKHTTRMHPSLRSFWWMLHWCGGAHLGDPDDRVTTEALTDADRRMMEWGDGGETSSACTKTTSQYHTTPITARQR